MATYFVYSSHSISLTFHNDRSSRTISLLSLFLAQNRSLGKPLLVRTSQVLELYITPRHVKSGVVFNLQFPDGHPVGGTFVWFPTPFLL
jgi:hypothetical protein